MSIELPVTLPEFLENADGEVRIAGHRLTLYDVLWEYNQGKTVEELVTRFPTVKRSTIHKVIAFYLDQQESVDTFLKAYTESLESHRARGKQAPSVAELQKRLEEIRRGACNAAQVSY